MDADCGDLAHGGEDGVGELGSAGGTADVAGKRLAFGVDGFERLLNLVCRGLFVEVVQHQDGGLQQGGRVGEVLAGNVGRGAVDGLEDGAFDARGSLRAQGRGRRQRPRKDR